MASKIIISYLAISIYPIFNLILHSFDFSNSSNEHHLLHHYSKDLKALLSNFSHYFLSKYLAAPMAPILLNPPFHQIMTSILSITFTIIHQFHTITLTQQIPLQKKSINL
jgi:hypothetical protein